MIKTIELSIVQIREIIAAITRLQEHHLMLEQYDLANKYRDMRFKLLEQIGELEVVPK